MAANGPYTDKDRLEYNKLLRNLQTEQTGARKGYQRGNR